MGFIGTTVGFVPPNSASAPPPPSSPWTANNPIDYVPRVTGVAGWGMDSAFGTAKKGETTVNIRIQRVRNTGTGTSEGSFKFAANLPSSTRTVVVFDTSGWVNLNDTYSIGQGNKTFAFQTAPSPGFFFKRGRLRISGGGNYLFWHCGVGNGQNTGVESSADALEVASASSLAFVNCAAWYGRDETFSFRNADKVTVYNSVVSHGLDKKNSGGADENRKFGMYIFGGDRFTITRNLFAHNKLRSPRANVRTGLDLTNNIIANANGVRQSSILGNVGDELRVNIQGNMWLAGPDTLDASEAMAFVSSSAASWPTDVAIYYPDGQDGRDLKNKFVGNFQTLANDANETPVTSAVSSATAHGSKVTSITGWTDAEMITNITNNVGPRPGDALTYHNVIKTQIFNMEDGVGDQGTWANTTATEAYTGSSDGFDTLAINSTDNFAAMSAAGVFDNATLVTASGDYRLYTFTASAGWTTLDEWLNAVANDAVMNTGWEV